MVFPIQSRPSSSTSNSEFIKYFKAGRYHLDIIVKVLDQISQSASNCCLSPGNITLNYITLELNWDLKSTTVAWIYLYGDVGLFLRGGSLVGRSL